MNINEKVKLFETYIISGERGSGVICVNGAAARLVQRGDVVIILSYAYVMNDEAKDHKPTVAIMNDNNTIRDIISYEPEATVM